MLAAWGRSFPKSHPPHQKGIHMALEVTGWLLLAVFMILTAALVELCEKIVSSVEQRRPR